MAPALLASVAFCMGLSTAYPSSKTIFWDCATELNIPKEAAMQALGHSIGQLPQHCLGAEDPACTRLLLRALAEFEPEL